MKKKRIIIISAIVLILLGSYIFEDKEGKFPSKIPNVNLIVNNEKYKLQHGDGNWFEKSMGGNSHIVPMNEVFTDKYPFIEVNSGDEIQFDISYKKNIQEITLFNVDFTESIDGRKMNGRSIDISNDKYSFKVPEEKKEYYYALYIKWDDTHNFDYLFRIKVK